MIGRQEAVTVLRLDTTQHDAAAAKAAAALGQVGQAGQMSARQTAAAMRGLPAQLTDVATSLAGGQNPLLVLLQQGGQVRDQFGSIGAAVRGLASFITPAALGVGAVAALGAAWLAAERDTRRFRDTLLLTNNATGLTEDRLEGLAARVSEASRATVGEARDIAMVLAEQGTVSGAVLEDMAEAVLRVASVSGKSATEVARDFARMRAGVADWAAEHNKAWNFISAEQYAYIRRLEEQGQAEEAQIFVAQRISDQLKQQAQDLGWLEKAWDELGKTASATWQAILKQGRDGGTAGRVQRAEEQLGRAERVQGTPLLEMMVGTVDEARAELEAAQEVARLERRMISDRATASAAARVEIERLREQERKDAAAKAAAAREAERLRERAFDRTPPLAGTDYRDRSDRLIPPPTPDPLGEFIVERVLPAERQRSEQRLQQQQNFLQSLQDSQAAANVALIADDRQRALAQIALEREQLQRRIELTIESGEARAEAERLADEASAARTQGVLQGFAKDAAGETRTEFRNALTAAFRDSRNPAKAFAEAMGESIFNRVTQALSDALANAVFGSAAGGGGLLGGLFGGVGDLVGDLFGGTRAGGGRVARGKVYEINEQAGPGEVFETRNGRSFLLAAQDGEIRPQPRTDVQAPMGVAAAVASVAVAMGQASRSTAGARPAGGVPAAVEAMLGGTRAGGGRVARGMVYQINEEPGPGEVFNARNGRSYLLAAQDGEIRPQPRSGAVAAAGGGGPTVVVQQTNHFGSDVSRAELARWAEAQSRATKTAVMQALVRNRTLATA